MPHGGTCQPSIRTYSAACFPDGQKMIGASPRSNTASRSVRPTSAPIVRPAATMRVNQLRLWVASMAYVRMWTLRRVGLAGTELARATCGTIRLMGGKRYSLRTADRRSVSGGSHSPSCACDCCSTYGVILSSAHNTMPIRTMTGSLTECSYWYRCRVWPHGSSRR